MNTVNIALTADAYTHPCRENQSLPGLPAALRLLSYGWIITVQGRSLLNGQLVKTILKTSLPSVTNKSTTIGYKFSRSVTFWVNNSQFKAEIQLEENHLSPSSLKLSMPSGCRLSARVFLLISLPVRRLPLFDSTWNTTHTTHTHTFLSHPLYHHLLFITVTIISTAVQPWPGSLQSLLPCQTALSSSWRRHLPSSLLPLPLFSGVPPDR